MLGKITLFWPKTRKSHPLSKLLRPVFEGKKPKKNFGIILIVLIFLSSLLVPSASASENYKNEELITLTAEIEVKTQEEAKLPFKLSENCYISQGFWLFHPAIDIAAPKGTPTYAIRTGKVIKVGYEGAYGKKVEIDHGNNLQSLYAHFSQIEVKEGQEVTQDTIIGRVGLSGWTTGSHLHLEIKENGKYLNPKTFLYQNQ